MRIPSQLKYALILFCFWSNAHLSICYGQSCVEVEKLTFGISNDYDNLGQALAGENNRIVAGIPGDYITSAGSTGSVNVYDWTGSAWQETQLLGNNFANAGSFGSAVDISGNRIVVGDRTEDVNSSNSGAAYLFEWDGVEWNIEDKFYAATASFNEFFGDAVCVDGDRIAIGVPFDNDNGSDSGSVYIYDWDGTSWIKTILYPSDPSSGDNFGTSIDLEGDRILVGSRNDDDAAPSSGSAYLFEWNGTSWLETKLLPSDGILAGWFGTTVALQNDRLVISANAPRNTSNDISAVYIYDWDGSNWIETKLIASDYEDGDNFGTAIDIQNDRIVIGSARDNDNGIESGSAYIYDWDGTNWNESKLLPTDGQAGDQYGYSARFFDGNKLLVGAWYDDDSNEKGGSFYLYNYENNSYNETDKFAEPLGALEKQFGQSFDFEGDDLLIGAPTDLRNGLKTGSANIYNRVGNNWLLDIQLFGSDSEEYDNFGSQVARDGDRIVISACNESSIAQGSGALYVYDWNGTNWIETKLKASDPEDGDNFGSDVAVFGDRILVGVPRKEDLGFNSGAIYLFDWNGSNWIETKITAFDGGVFDQFGISVALWQDRFVVGASNDDDADTDAGAIYIYDWDGTMWIPTKITAFDALFLDHFGEDVDICEDHIVVGAKDKNGISSNSGSIYVLENDGMNWVQTKITASDAARDDNFGSSVSLVKDKIVVGAENANQNGIDSGTAYIFERIAGVWEEKEIIQADGYVNNHFGFEVDASNDYVAIGINSLGVESVYIYGEEICLTNQAVVNNPIPTNVYYAQQSVSTSSTIQQSGNVTFHAGNEVRLDQAFEVPSGAVFEAFIEGCQY